MDNGLNVYSDIGVLKTVLLHRPGNEINNLMPDLLERLLFDDIPFLELAVEEHDVFANILRDKGIEVLYLENLVTESIADKRVREKFIEEFANESGVIGKLKKDSLIRYLSDFNDNKELVLKTMCGIQKTELVNYKPTLIDSVNSNYPFVVDPLPNLYFTRDPFSIIGNGVSLHNMRTVTRNRETLYGKYIFKYHPRFKDKDIPMWYDRDELTSLEGGDELVLSKEVLGIGISERTDAESVEKIADKIFKSNSSFKTILAFNIPKKRAFMHLDTVFTMIDYDKFIVHPEIEGPLTAYAISKSEKGNLIIEDETMSLEDILKKHLNRDKITIIRCGGDNIITAAREQWSDGSNALAIAPGEVIAYSRNKITNELLNKAGIKVHIMPSSELSRGRGGPRCMSMPFYREDL